jgi:formylmethanofuran dehydrogenase subunit E
MNADQIFASDDFSKCAAFHGHICPGLSLGYVAGKAALNWIKETHAPDEEVVAIVENDSCFVDAIQVLTGCTFGKGNFIYKDYGKMALTLLSRRTNSGVRLSLLPGAFSPDDKQMALRQKVMQGQADETEKKLFQEFHRQRSRNIVESPVEKLFTVNPIEGNIPDKARIAHSEPCARCGEPTMVTKLVEVNGGRICRGCAGR